MHSVTLGALAVQTELANAMRLTIERNFFRVFRGSNIEEPETLQITINGEERQIDDGLSLAQLIEQLGMKPKFIAVERNRELVPRAEHATCTLEENDQLEIVTLVGGG